MNQLVSLLDQQNILAFLLLFARVISFMAFIPILKHKSVTIKMRAAISFYLAIFLFPLIDYSNSILTSDTFVLALLSELTLGLLASALVQIIFSAVQIAGDLIGYATGLSMANMFDPTTGTQQGVISRFLYLIVFVIYLESDMYELTIYMLYNSFGMISLGHFNIYDYDGIAYVTKEINNMFAFALTFAFPLFFISFIIDVYYGYGTKSMPSFSPFIITFQIKFTLIFIFMMLGLNIFIDNFILYFTQKLS